MPATYNLPKMLLGQVKFTNMYLDLETGKLEFEDGIQAITEFSPKPNQDLNDFAEIIKTAYRKSFLNLCKLARIEGENFDIELEIISPKTKTQKWICLRTQVLIDEARKPKKIQFLIEDIHSRKSQELRQFAFRTALKELTLLTNQTATISKQQIQKVLESAAHYLKADAGILMTIEYKTVEILNVFAIEKKLQNIEEGHFFSLKEMLPHGLKKNEVYEQNGQLEIQYLGIPIHAYLAIPFTEGSKKLCILSFLNHEKRNENFHDEEKEYIELISLWMKNALERRRAEIFLQKEIEKNELLVEATEQGIWEWNSNREEIDISNRFKEMFGYESHELGSDFSEIMNLIHPEDKIKAYSQLRKFFKNKRDILGVELRFIHKSGEIIYVLAQAKVKFDSDKNPSRIVGSVVDISKQKKVQVALEQAKNAAEESTKAKSDFLSVMSHEIRTPMNAVIALSDLLISENPRTDQLEKLDVLKFSAENLLAIINDVLDYSKIEAGKIDFKFQNVNIRDLLNNVCQLNLPKATENGNKLEVHVDAGLPEILRIDKVRISQVLNNLISNACKFTKNGQIDVSASLTEKRANKVKIRFGVKDNGIGMSIEKQNLIFERFTQIHNDVSRQYGGTGLGLAISKAIIDALDGEVGVKSAPMAGTYFYIDIWMETIDLEMQKVNSMEEEVDIAKLNLKLLVAEDNKMNQFVIKSIMNKFSIDFVIAENGKIAIEPHFNQEFDIILMDIQMPVMDGYEATKKIRAWEGKKSKIPIIVLSAATLDEIEGKFDENEITDFMLKPIKPNDLKDKLIKNLEEIYQYRKLTFNS